MEGFDSRALDLGEEKTCEVRQHWWGKEMREEETIDIGPIG